jgi:hypothetical protein
LLNTSFLLAIKFPSPFRPELKLERTSNLRLWEHK